MYNNIMQMVTHMDTYLRNLDPYQDWMIHIQPKYLLDVKVG